MKLLKKLSKDSNLVYFLIAAPLMALLLSFVVTYKNETIFIFSNRIPMAIGKDFLLTINKYVLKFLFVITTFFTIIVFSSMGKERKNLIIFFPIYLFFITYFSVFIVFGYIPVFKSFLFLSINIFIIYGFLLLIEKIFSSSVLSSIVILLIQLIGGGVIYLFEFKDFFNNEMQKMIVIMYSILPIYNKTLEVFENGDYKYLIINICVSIAIFIIECFTYVKMKKNNKKI